MRTILEDLGRDHRNLSALLEVLEHQLDCLRNGEQCDYELIEAVLHYCKSYGDAHHHPTEDRLYAEVERAGGLVAELTASLHEDHRELAALTDQLHAAVERVLQGAVTPRERIENLLARFVSDYRGHMTMEERFLFPAAQRCLSEGDLAQLAARSASGTDPLFGAQVESRFAVLREHIQALDRSSRPPGTRGSSSFLK